MTLDDIINELRERLLQNMSLEVLCYYFIKNNDDQLEVFNEESFIGEAEQIAFYGYKNIYAEKKDIDKLGKKLKYQNYLKGLQIYHYIGFSLQDSINNSCTFDTFLNEQFNKHSIKYKYLIAKVFSKYNESLKNQLLFNQNNKYSDVLKHIYLDTNINISRTLHYYVDQLDNLDIIDLLVLEDLQNIKAIGYDKTQDRLFNDIFWASTEIQSKHNIQNNSEDQFNSLFQTLLIAKGYKAHDQSQRGQSSDKKQAGELDIIIFDKEDIPLSIFEAFKLESIDSTSIIRHLKKLSENYDPNGLRNNYAVIYAKSNNFDALWSRYKVFVTSINFEHELVDKNILDVSDRFPQLAGIRIGLTTHLNRQVKVRIYHIFMDMNF